MKRLIFPVLLVLILVSCDKEVAEVITVEQEKANVCSFAKGADLGTVEYTVVKVIKANDVPEWYKFGDRKILFNCKATLKAGIDMAKFSEEDVTIDQVSKHITICLPAPQLLNLDIKPDDIKLVYEKVSFFRSDFSANDRNSLLAQGEKDINDNIAELGILADAEKNARLYFETMLQQMGYTSVTIKFKEE